MRLLILLALSLAGCGSLPKPPPAPAAPPETRRPAAPRSHDIVLFALGLIDTGYRFGGNGDFLGHWNLDDRTRDLTRGLPVHGLLRMKEPDPLGAGRSLAESGQPGDDVVPPGRWWGRVHQTCWATRPATSAVNSPLR